MNHARSTIPLGLLLPVLAAAASTAQTPAPSKARQDPPPATAPDAQKAPAAVQPSTSELIEQLGDASYRKRRAAEQALGERGTAALDALKAAAADHDDEEIRWRAGRLVRRLGDGRGSELKPDGRVPPNAKRLEELDEISPESGRRGAREGEVPELRDVRDQLQRMFDDDRFGPLRGRRGIGNPRDLFRRLEELDRQMDDAWKRLDQLPRLDLQPGGVGRGMTMRIGPENVRIEVQEPGEDGELETKVYEAPTQDAFRERYPEIAERYLDGFGNGTNFRFDLRGLGRGFGSTLRDRAPLERDDARSGRGARRPGSRTLTPDVRGETGAPPIHVTPDVDTLEPPPPGERLGVYVEPVAEPIRQFLGLEPGQGLVVQRIVEGSLAEALELRVGDVLTRIAGRKLFTASDVATALRGIEVGEAVDVELNRRGRQVSATAKKPTPAAIK